MISSKSRIFAVALALLGLGTSINSSAALTSLERHGRVLAVRLCAQCHAIGKSGASPQVGAPLLRQLEARVDLDTFARRLRQGLMSSHPDMPVFRFTREDARAMVAYLRSIQGP